MRNYILKSLILICLNWLGCKPGQNYTEKSKVSKTFVVDDATIDSGDIHKIIDPVWWSIEIHEGEAVYEESSKNFSIPQRQIVAIQWYLGEVNNGGHDQFYLNSTGIVWEDALNGLKKIGAGEIASILAESTQRMGGKPNKDRSQRQAQLTKLEPKFHDLDERLYSSQANIEQKIRDYIRKNRAAFYFKGDVKVYPY